MSERVLRRVKRFKLEAANLKAEFARIGDLPSATIQVLVNDIGNAINTGEELLTMWEDELDAIDEEEEHKEASLLLDAEFGNDGLQTLIVWLKKAKREATTIQANKAPPAAGPDPCIPKNEGLPTLKIPKFSSGLKEFVSFWQTFEDNIGKKQMPKSRKLAYLLQYLDGEAAQSVEGFTPTDNNYDTVVKILKERFDDRDGLSTRLASDFIAIPKAPKDYPQLRKTTDKMTALLRQLQALNVDVDNGIYFNQIESKLPAHIRRHVMSVRDKDNRWTVEKAINAMNEQLSLDQRIYEEDHHGASVNCVRPKPPAPQKPYIPERREFKPPEGKSSVATFPNNVPLNSPSPVRPPRKCVFCDLTHASSSCLKYATLIARKKRLSELSRCEHCTRSDHNLSQCTVPTECMSCKEAGHVIALCPKRATSKSFTVIKQSKQDVKTSLMVAICDITNPTTNETHQLTAILDSGSDTTFITKEAAQYLNLVQENHRIVETIGVGGHRHLENSADVHFVIATSEGNLDMTASTKTKITPPVIRVVVPEEIDEHTKLEDLQYSNESVDLLIGTDYFFEFVRSVKVINEDIKVTVTTLGTLYSGVLPIASESDTNVSALCINQEYVFAEDKLFNLPEGDGDSDNEEDLLVQKSFDETTKLVDGHYQVRLRFRPTKKPLKSNLGLCYGRLNTLLKKLRTNPEGLMQYHNEMMSMLANGTAEEAKPEPPAEPEPEPEPEIEPGSESGPKPAKPKVPTKLVHYSPHSGIFKPESATTKIRPVFDANAKPKLTDVGLNDCLYKGPKLLPDLTGILIRLRGYKFVVCGDIKKAFHQVHIHPDDRDVLRFLWVKDPMKDPSRDNILHIRFIGAPFGVNLSPYLLNATVRRHMQDFGPGKDEVLANTYVDNVAYGGDNKAELADWRDKLQSHFEKAGMQLREWQSNATEVLESVPEDLRQKPEDAKLLGIRWDPSSDTIHLKLLNEGKYRHHRLSKRVVLAIVAGTFDPLGVLSPCTIRGRILFQSLWNEQLSWDDPLPEEYEHSFRTIMEDWKGAIITLPRQTCDMQKSNTLHVFCDASSEAMCAAAYVVGESSSNLVMAKARVKTKKTTIPKLELNAAWLGAKLLEFLVKQLNFNGPKHLWIDNTSVLSWLKTCPDNTYIKRRVTFIHSVQAEYHYVKTKENPADLATRGLSFDDLQRSALWFKGPSWLIDSSFPVEEPEEVKTFTVTTREPAKEPEVLIDLSRFSSFYKTARVVALVHKACDYFRKRSTREPELSRFRFKQAVQTLLKQEQAKFQDKLAQPNFCRDDDGVIHFQNRIDQKFPWVIPKESRLAELVLTDFHKVMCHTGAMQTLAAVRELFWITNGRATAKKVVNRCVTCAKNFGSVFALPPMPKLPDERKCRSLPFQYCGIDYFGPMECKEGSDTVKTWGVIITCFTTRACHLDLVTDMTTKSFMRTLRQFIARNGTPSLIVSDNAKQFKTASETLSLLWQEIQASTDFKDYNESKAIKWQFIVEKAPWQGGFYERLIKGVKERLKSAIGRRKLQVSDMKTLLTEVEAIVNSRPLTYIEAEEGTVLRPIDLIRPGVKVGIPFLNINSDDPTFFPNLPGGPESLVEDFRKTTATLDRFWKLWYDNYLNDLKAHSPLLHHQGKTVRRREPLEGEMALLLTDGRPRAQWPLVRVTRVLRSEDGEVRSVVMKLESGLEIRRPPNHLIPLEVPSSPEHDPPSPEAPQCCDAAQMLHQPRPLFTRSTSEENPAATDNVPTRPTRASIPAGHTDAIAPITDGHVTSSDSRP